jgi:CheY-like chemotaxis protein
VSTASTSREALDLATARPFDLLISDLGLPDCSGHELVQQIHLIRNVPAIALSGYGMESDVERSHQVGFLAHLTKPVDINVLDATIEKITRAELLGSKE